MALFDIGKTRSDEFLDSLESLLVDRGVKTARYAKPTNAKTAPIETIQAVATEADLVVSALADWGSCTSCGLHDIKNLDDRGIPGCFVITTEFKDAAEVQSQALGFEPGIVWAPHPIQNRTEEELKQIAASLVDDILAMLVSD